MQGPKGDRGSWRKHCGGGQPTSSGSNPCLLLAGAGPSPTGGSCQGGRALAQRRGV